jgi:hypothetical protein
MWSDQQNWPADLRTQFSLDPKIQEFITAAMQLAGEGNGSVAPDRPTASGEPRGSRWLALRPDR